MAASLLMGQARRHGVYWEMHSALYQLKAQLGSDEIAALKRKFNLPGPANPDETALDKAAIERDIKQGNELMLKGTPTFYLCCPAGRMYRLDSLDQVELLMQ
jgi:protein-disulfide isomerase